MSVDLSAVLARMTQYAAEHEDEQALVILDATSVLIRDMLAALNAWAEYDRLLGTEGARIALRAGTSFAQDNVLDIAYEQAVRLTQAAGVETRSAHLLDEEN